MRRIVGSVLAASLVCLSALASPAASAVEGTNKADDSVRSDLRAVATMMETHLTDFDHYPFWSDIHYNGRRGLVIGEQELTLGFGNRLKAIKLTEVVTDGYCIKIGRAEDVAQTTKNWRLVSGPEGIKVNTGPCPDRFVATSYPAPPVV